MKIGQVLTKETVAKLGEENYNKFREYLIVLGHNIGVEFGAWSGVSEPLNTHVVLFVDDKGCDLLWAFWNEIENVDEFTYEQVMECIQ